MKMLQMKNGDRIVRWDPKRQTGFMIFRAMCSVLELN